MHGPRKVKGPIENVQVREALASFRVPGVRRGRDDTIPVRMFLLERGHDLAEKMNLAHAHAMKPSARLVAVPEKSLPGDFSPQTAPIFAGGYRLVNQPGGKEEQDKKIDEIEQVRHGSPFPSVIFS